MNQNRNVPTSSPAVFAPMRSMVSQPALPAQAPPFSQGNIILMVFAVLLLVNHLGKPFEHVLVGMRIPAVICSAAIVAAVVFGLPALKTKVGLALLAFFGWMLLMVPLSTWRGGSMSYVITFVQFWLPVFLVLACAPKTMRQFRFLCVVLAVSCLFNIIVAGQFGGDSRFAMKGTFGNSDDAAILAGFAIPFWLLMSRQLPLLLRMLVSIAGTLFLLRVMVLTATRSILVSLLGVFLVWFFRTTVIARLAGVIGVAIAAVLIVATTPTSVLERLSTTFDVFSSTPDPEHGEATQSAAERRSLLKDGLWTTITHPVWGVGPGQFGQYRWNALGTPIQRKTWFKTHNTYIEVSADNGIPGLILYLVLLWSIYRVILKVRNASASQSSDTLRSAFQFAMYAELAWVFFVITAMFMTVEAHPYVFVLAGLAVAAERLVSVELAHAPKTQPVLPQAKLAPYFAGMK